MHWKSSYTVAVGILAAVALVFIIGSIFGGHEEDATAAETETAAGQPDPLVQTAIAPEQVRPYAVVMRGRTEPARAVVVRAETAGTVASVPAREGGFVGKGQVLCRLSVDARQASLDQARAHMKSRELQRDASANLAEKGYRSQQQVLQDQANLDAAAAAVRQAEVALDQINIRAPFAGVFDKREAEIGDYLAPGQPCGMVLELNPLLVVGDISETDIGKVRVGARATAKLVSGETLSGRVRYVARDADAQTRTYRVEVEVANPSSAASSGLSAQVSLSSGAGPAHLIPESALVLDAEGRQGVRYVRPDNRVGFAAITVIGEGEDGVWISGLSGDVRLITAGQSYVSEGQKVRVAAR